MEKLTYFLTVFLLILISTHISWASDHSDTSLHIETGRNDARITDLYAFTQDENLILILNIDPTVPVGATTYNFPTDVEYMINIDNDSRVTPEGEIVDKNSVKEDLTISIRFDEDGTAKINDEISFTSILAIPFLMLYSCSSEDVDIEDAITNFFAGPRDDPFIRGPRIGANIAAIVIEVPVEIVVKNGDPLLIWATTSVDDFDGDFQERAGSPFRSMLNELLNFIHPSEDSVELGVDTDVLILDPSLPSGFPNGRILEDDVVDQVCPGLCDAILANDAPFPSENDVPFLDEFPFLAPPN